MRTAVVLVVAVALLAAAAIYGALLLTREDPEPDVAQRRASTWTSYAATDRGLVVEKTTNTCTDIEEVTVVETAERVEVTVWVAADSESCPATTVTRRAQVGLNDPLGSRRVYDGACLADEEVAKRCRRDG